MNPILKELLMNEVHKLDWCMARSTASEHYLVAKENTMQRLQELRQLVEQSVYMDIYASKVNRKNNHI